MTESQALAKVASYCSRAERCENDVRKKLLAWKLDFEASNRIVVRLQQEGFLSEERFCRAYIRDKVRFSKWGKTKISFELKKRRVSDSLIRSTFEELSLDEDLDESLEKLLKVKIPTVKANSEYEKRMKLFRFALGRGYSSASIQKCLNKLTGSTEDEPFISC